MKKKKKTWIIWLSVIIIAAIFIGYYFYFDLVFGTASRMMKPHFADLMGLGYSQEEIKKIYTLEEIEVDKLVTVGYEKDIYNIFKEKYFILDNLNRYVQYKKIDNNNYIEMVNTNRDYDYYSTFEAANLLSDNLILVNKYYYLENTYVPSDLVKVTHGYGYLKKDANDAYTLMYNAAKKSNITLSIQSSYRSYELQETLYNNYVLEDGIILADRYSARPGTSEHQTGLAIDFMVPGSTLDKFNSSKEFTWLQANAYKYGFILRYPSDKENITGYMYESWHYRYVGNDVAKYIYDNEITFDEYYEYFVANKKD